MSHPPPSQPTLLSTSEHNAVRRTRGCSRGGPRQTTASIYHGGSNKSRVISRGRAEPSRANSPQNRAARELHGQPLTRVSRTERDDGAQAARSDTSARYARAVYHGGRGYIGRGRMGSYSDPFCGIPLAFVCAAAAATAAGKSDYTGEAFFSLPREFASRPRRDATLISSTEDGTGTLTTLHFYGSD